MVYLDYNAKHNCWLLSLLSMLIYTSKQLTTQFLLCKTKYYMLIHQKSFNPLTQHRSSKGSWWSTKARKSGSFRKWFPFHRLRNCMDKLTLTYQFGLIQFWIFLVAVTLSNKTSKCIYTIFYLLIPNVNMTCKAKQVGSRFPKMIVHLSNSSTTGRERQNP